MSEASSFALVRTELEGKLRSTRAMLALMLVVDVAIVGATVLLAMNGWIYISIPLILAALGSTGHTAHRIYVLRDHLAALDRRHVPLPTATAHLKPGSD